MPALPTNVEDIHPALWKGSQLGRAAGVTVEPGYQALSAELPGGGWPLGALIDMMPQQSGIGELRILAPALAKLASRPIVLLKPVQTPNIHGLAHIGLPLENLMLLRPSNTADTLWSAEQILRAKTCGALLVWQQHVREESLRRLRLAAKSGDSLLVLFRPLAAAADASPAELRLCLRPVDKGVSVDIVKRRGPTMDGPIQIELRPSPILLSPHGRSRRAAPTLVPQWTPLGADA
ncbi:translesion DNA synthesis-associated protein ImuA (plasmid) [Paraburkholderia sprentiae WSM5005]|uniref:Translesion DNA synthesis-associated protein ImuA n=1 Tax=Paraburkholderia sprentiae WSM5005 TaxID=754502 RepID=A0ACA8AX65_9BURK|nr:translesion DNA synthesis-associated protein ImuA [Paraburkholderia sprentiae]APA90257.1 translesion DNA synthesis-associated protein ImuA [Paraburkholderia sprentiae WSM5005]